MKDATSTAPIQVAPVQLHDCPQAIQVFGSLLGDEEAVVGAKVAGRVNQVKVDLGTRVRRGDSLAVLDLEDFEIRIKQVRAELAAARSRLGLKSDQGLDQLDRNRAPLVVQKKAVLDGAEANYFRAKSMLRSNALAAEEYQLRETALRVAEADYHAALHQVDEQIALLEKHANTLTLAEHALADATVTAPFDGIVSDRHVAPGVYLQVGDSVVTLVRTDPLRFQAGVPEDQALLVKAGQKAVITIDGQNSPLSAQVSRISPVLDMASRSLPVEIDVPNAELRLRAGLFAEAEILVDPSARALAVPRSSIVAFAGVEKVYVVEDGKAVLRRVVTGRKLNDLVEIVEGLSLGDQVAVQGQSARPGPVDVVQVVPPALAKGARPGTGNAPSPPQP